MIKRLIKKYLNIKKLYLYKYINKKIQGTKLWTIKIDEKDITKM